MPVETHSERVADALVHAVGLACAVAFTVTLALLAASDPSPGLTAVVAVYGAGIIAMWSCSTLYNLSEPGPWQQRFRRMDHAAIYLMIIGTYTPFCIVTLGGPWGYGLLAVVWTVGLLGAVAKLCGFEPSPFVAASGYLILGWAVLAAAAPIFEAMSTVGVVLLGVGGLCYSVGVLFHLHRRLPYQRAIWHGFVLAGASFHFAAILTDVIGGPGG